MTGCWTCKVRKKKCGEEKPTCSICRSLGLDCSGYRQRPEWMDGGIKEKEMLTAIREMVKEVTSQKKRLAMLRQKHANTSQGLLYPAILNVPLPPSPTAILPSAQEGNPQQDKPLLIDGPPSGLKAEHAAAYIAQNEHILLMHYLDEVFPSQFRFYQPSLESGGRGWFLTLLLQTKPLYHAACSLAAYHRQMLYCLRAGMEKAYLTGEALHLQYDIAIKELRKYLDILISSDRERTLVEDVQLLCSITLLVSIEVSDQLHFEDRIHICQ